MFKEIRIKLCIFILPIFLLSCSPSNPKGVKISGKITLEGATDFSGVKVSIFNLPLIDTSISNAVEKFSPLKIPELAYLIFDHRREKPLQITYTDANGNYSFSDVLAGEYILVLEKEGYGWNYFKISTYEQMKEITVKKETQISEQSNADVIRWEYGNIVIKNSIKIENWQTLVIYPGVIVRFEPGKKIEVNGKIIISDTSGTYYPAAIFTANDTITRWDGLYINNSAEENKITNLVLSYSNNGLYVNSSNLEVKNSIFLKNASFGISAVQIGMDKKLAVKNSIFADQPIGINTEFCDTTSEVANSIFFKNSETGINCITSGLKIYKNYFTGNKNSIITRSNVNTKTVCIWNNELVNSKDYHLVFRGGNTEVKYNNIYSVKGGIAISPYYGNPVVWINYNNIMGLPYLIALYTHDTDARFNYWGTTSEAEIQNLIFDRNDVSPSDPYYNRYGVVDYSNYLREPVKEAGIR